MKHRKNVESPEGLRFLGRVRELCMALPEVVEAVDGFGHTSFRIRDKPFVMLGEGGGGPSMSIKVGIHTQEFLVRRPEFEVSRYIGRHGWTSVRSAEVSDWAEIALLVEEAYRGVAPQSLLRQLPEGTSPPSPLKPGP